MSDRNLAYQFSGPYVQNFMRVVQEKISSRDAIIAYLRDLSIATATGVQLETIGGMVGFPWGNAPENIFGDNNLLFGPASSFPTIDNLTGFGESGTSAIGGLFSSSSPAVGNRIPIDLYRLLLVQVAYLKAHGLTMVAIDQICHVFASDYTIVYGEEFGSYLTLGSYFFYPTYSVFSGLSGLDPEYTLLGGLLSGIPPVGYVDSDIYVIFNTQIGPGYLWLIQQIFDRFTTSPKVFVVQGA